LNVLVVGLGRQGQRHLRIALGMAGVDVVGTVDPRHGGAEAVPHFRTVEAALEGAGQIDAAVVAVPTIRHVPATTPLLLRGVPTLVEKPLASSVLEAQELVTLAESSGVLLAAGHVERFNPAVQLVHAMLANGSLGTPIAFAFRRVGLPPVDPAGVDVIHDLAVHDIDVFGMLVGSAPALRGVAGWPADGLIESAHLLLKAGSVNGLVQVNWRTPVRLRDFTVTTDECYVEVNYTTQNVDVVRASDSPDYIEFADFQSHYGTAERVHLESRPAEPLAEELGAFLGVVAGRPVSGLALGADGVRALEIADAASAALGDRNRV
jgi:UDP-N-acetylglucosamine 3-dehydrogenase